MNQNNKKNIFDTLMIFFGLMLLLSGTSHAYIDPGTGSLIFQAIIAVGLGAMITFRAKLSAIKKLFNKDETDGKEENKENN